MIDFKRRTDVVATVERLSTIPTVHLFIALVKYPDGNQYIIAPQRSLVGDVVTAGKILMSSRNAMEIGSMRRS
jgi:large subunit ribosomal protein L2